MRISAKVDYALRAAAELAAVDGTRPLKAELIATNQAIPRNFLENILTELRHAGLVRTQRGPDGGSVLARPAVQISVADVIRAVEGPLAAVQGQRPDELAYEGAAGAMADVWLAVRANLRAVLEAVTLADVANRDLPETVRHILDDPETRKPH